MQHLVLNTEHHLEKRFLLLEINFHKNIKHLCYYTFEISFTVYENYFYKQI